MSTDGRFIVFQSEATNLVSGDTNTVSEILLRDRQAGTCRLRGRRSERPRSIRREGGNVIAADEVRAYLVFYRDMVVLGGCPARSISTRRRRAS
jgi:hypothetical protein